MYEYRDMTEAERAKVLTGRKLHLRPWHAPPHFDQTTGTYLISAACYEHQPIIATKNRLTEWEMTILGRLGQGIEVHAWVVLPNHYHLLFAGDLTVFARRIARLHNGIATQWNRENGTPGRKVWHRFSDRVIRSERHYYASLNYIHTNPVKHGHAPTATIWEWSSLSVYLETIGREQLTQWWRQYPIGDYGKGWDE